MTMTQILVLTAYDAIIGNFQAQFKAASKLCSFKYKINEVSLQ